MNQYPQNKQPKKSESAVEYSFVKNLMMVTSNGQIHVQSFLKRQKNNPCGISTNVFIVDFETVLT